MPRVALNKNLADLKTVLKSVESSRDMVIKSLPEQDATFDRLMHAYDEHTETKINFEKNAKAVEQHLDLLRGKLERLKDRYNELTDPGDPSFPRSKSSYNDACCSDA